jgi:O-antigen/teichoic acid export membrane protein
LTPSSSHLPFDRNVRANLRIKALSEVVVKLSRFGLLVGAARLLGQDRFGLYAFALAAGNIVGNMGDFGLQLYLSREVARGKLEPGALLRQTIRAKLLLSGIALLLLGGGLLLFPRPVEEAGVFFLLGAAGLLLSWIELANYFFRGLQSLRQEALLNTTQTILATGSGLTVLLAGGGVLPLAVSQLLSAAATLALAAFLLRGPGALPAGSPVPAPRIALAEAAPIGIAILLSVLYFRIDVFFLERIRGNAEVGAYTAAYKLIEGFLFLPAILLSAVFPAFTAAIGRGAEETARIYRASLRSTFFVSLGISAGLAVLAPTWLRILYGEAYVGSAPTLRLLAPALVFIFPNYALTHFLVALGGQKYNALFGAICVAVNALGNLLTVPAYGAMGSAAMTVATEATLFGLCLWKVRALRARVHPGAGSGG